MRSLAIIKHALVWISAFSLFLFIHSANSLEFFYINGVTYELLEIDIGRQLGCKPGRYTAVVIRNSESQEELWSYPSSDEIKSHYFHNNECYTGPGSGLYVETERIWPEREQFMVSTMVCGASCHPGGVTVFQFDGKNVTQILALSGTFIFIDFMEPDFTAIYQRYDGECMPCPKIWVRDVYKWNGKTYKRINRQVSKTKSEKPPWQHQLRELKY